MINGVTRKRSLTDGFSIGSFNVLKFQWSDREDREEKARHIADLIRAENFAVVCLQECYAKDDIPNTLTKIVSFLNYGLPFGKYDGVHSSELYKRLKDDGYKFRSVGESRGEYAFIWDATRVELACDATTVYDRINEQLTRGLGAAISAGAILAASGLSVLNRMRRKCDGDKGLGHRLRRVASASVVVAPVIGSETMIGARHKAIQTALYACLRIPFVGIFKLKTDENKQLRIINVHTQWSKVKGESISGKTAREVEMKYLLDHAFAIVNEQRSGLSETVFTVMAGDFNYTAAQIEALKLQTDRGASLTIAQRMSSKPRLANRIAVERKKEFPRFEPIPGHDYDHFVFSRPCWNANSGMAVYDQDSFIMFEGYARRPVSDHYPVKLTTFHL